MCGTYRAARTLRCARATLTTLAGLAVAGVTYRLHRASTISPTDLATATATAIAVIGALTAGWALHVRKIRARARDEAWEALRLRHRETLLDGDEDRALWESVPAASSEHDTCAIGVNVVALAQYRQHYPQAG